MVHTLRPGGSGCSLYYSHLADKYRHLLHQDNTVELNNLKMDTFRPHLPGSCVHIILMSTVVGVISGAGELSRL